MALRSKQDKKYRYDRLRITIFRENDFLNIHTTGIITEKLEAIVGKTIHLKIFFKFQKSWSRESWKNGRIFALIKYLIL